MATLRFSFGTMGSGKSTMALQIHHNLRQPRAVRPAADDARPRGCAGDQPARRRRARRSTSAGDLDLYKLAVDHWPMHYLVCDEAQFYTVTQCDQLARAVDDLGVDVFAFGLITDFRGELFEGTKRMLEIADERVPMQVEARCWCGARATHNARVVNGEITYEGETVVVGDTDELGRAAAVRRHGALRAAVPPPLPQRRARRLASEPRRSSAGGGSGGDHDDEDEHADDEQAARDDAADPAGVDAAAVRVRRASDRRRSRGSPSGPSPTPPARAGRRSRG